MKLQTKIAAITRKLLARAIGMHEHALYSVGDAYLKKLDAAVSAEWDAIELSRRANDQKKAAARRVADAGREMHAVRNAIDAEMAQLPRYSK